MRQQIKEFAQDLSSLNKEFLVEFKAGLVVSNEGNVYEVKGLDYYDKYHIGSILLSETHYYLGDDFNESILNEKQLIRFNECLEEAELLFWEN